MELCSTLQTAFQSPKPSSSSSTPSITPSAEEGKRKHTSSRLHEIEDEILQVDRRLSSLTQDSEGIRPLLQMHLRHLAQQLKDELHKVMQH